MFEDFALLWIGVIAGAMLLGGIFTWIMGKFL